MSSRLSQRAKKQEKYRRHVASLTSNANNEDTEPQEEAYNPIKPKIRYVAKQSSDEPAQSKQEASDDYKKRYRNKYPGQRTGRSLTRTTGPNSRSSSVSSNGSIEPGKITPRPRPGRSLTRSSSIDGNRPGLPTRRSLSAKKGGRDDEHSREPSLTRVAVVRARSTSRDPEANPESGANTSASNIRPLSSRSPFAKLLAEKKTNVASSKKRTAGKSKYDVKSTKKVEPETSAPVKAPKAKTAPTTPVETEKDEKPSSTPETNEEAKVPEAKGSADEPELVDEPEDLPSDEEVPFDAVNVSVLSEENVEKHTKEEIVDEFGDPPLEELESEVTTNTDLDNVVHKYMASNSILASLATSPVNEVASPSSDTQNHLASNSILEALSANPEPKVASNDIAAGEENAGEIGEEKKKAEAVASTSHAEVTNGMVDEKKESDEDEDTIPPALKAWDMANPEFANFTPSQDEEFSAVEFNDDVWEPETETQFVGSAFSKPEDDQKAEPVQNEFTSSPKAEEPVEEASSPQSNKNTVDTVDMFDTSSWAAGTVTDFSNASFPKVEMDMEADKNFVNMMKEEMKHRTLTEEEQKLMFEANEKIIQAEEKAKEEVKAQKDDEPLIVKRSDSVEGSEANTAVSLEDRLKAYATNEPDEDSGDSSGDSDDQESSGDEDEVAYVGQNNEEEAEPTEQQGDGTEEAPIDLVASTNVPTLQVAASAASAQEIPYIPKTLSEFKMTGVPPPPPPPGRPKKKKKKKKSKSSTVGKNKIPLLAPPSEEKLKNWKGDQKKAQDYVAAMAERLADTATKTLDASSEYFHFKKKESTDENEDGETPVEDNAAIEEPKQVESDTDAEHVGDVTEIPDSDDVVSPDDATEDDSVAAFAKKVQLANDQAVLQNTEKNNLWKREVDDAMGLVERLEEEYDKGQFPELSMFPSPLSDDELVKKKSQEQENVTKQCDEATNEEVVKNNTDTDTPTLEIQRSPTSQTNGSLQPILTVDVKSSPTKINESFFASPKSSKAAKPEGSGEKTKASSTGLVLTDSKMADKFVMASSAAADTFEKTFSPRNAVRVPKEYESLAWFTKNVLNKEFTSEACEVDVSTAANLLLEDMNNFNAMCRFVADTVNEVSIEINPELKTASTFDTAQMMSRSLSSVPSGDPMSLASGSMSTTSSGDSDDKPTDHKRILLRPVILSEASIKLSGKYLAANFVSFLFMAAKLAKVPSPFGDRNPFLAMIVESSLETISGQDSTKTTPQQLIFEQLDGKMEKIFDFVHQVKTSSDAEKISLKDASDETKVEKDAQPAVEKVDVGKRFIVPEGSPSPFEQSISEAPRIMAAVLSFLGDPVAVCQMKKVNHTCRRIVSENEHTLMQDAVRSGGIDSKHRPAFWMHVALEKSDATNRRFQFNGTEELKNLELSAEEGKWHHVIHRDVERSFGNMPPHKTGAKFRSDSIVEALVTWGQSRLMKRGVKGGGEPVPIPEIGDEKEKVTRQATSISSPPWADETKGFEDGDIVNKPTSTKESSNDAEESPIEASFEEIALCGNSLSADEKADLQKKISFILHTLAASYEDIGYCQGMDYVVAHLLRNLLGTIRSKAANKQLPAVISTASVLTVTDNIELLNKEIDSNLVIEETIVRMIDIFFVNYNLKHMYWPELRCLKTCCRVFERLIQIKLPVLADHFEHHDLNIGLFALGWFQTLFLYLPSMPSATVNHMWDIWLVERSFKIFFRVGTAILFLSQPILLNHELEGMMTYLNTIPDATLLRPDILIPCALNIKVTNRLLQELEDEVMKNPN